MRMTKKRKNKRGRNVGRGRAGKGEGGRGGEPTSVLAFFAFKVSGKMTAVTTKQMRLANEPTRQGRKYGFE